jgi:hypothetical protein
VTVGVGAVGGGGGAFGGVADGVDVIVVAAAVKTFLHTHTHTHTYNYIIYNVRNPTSGFLKSPFAAAESSRSIKLKTEDVA